MCIRDRARDEARRAQVDKALALAKAAAAQDSYAAAVLLASYEKDRWGLPLCWLISGP